MPSTIVAASKKKETKLDKRKRLVKKGLAGAQCVSDLQRVLSLPVELSLTPEEHEAFCRENQIATSFEDGWRFREAQSNGIVQYLLYRGAFLPIGVGHGKTIISLAICDHAYRSGKKKILLLIPPGPLQQLVETDIKAARSKIPISFPIHVLGGMSIERRRRLAHSNRPGVYIFPYSLLSAKDAVELLDGIAPETVVADEAHNVARRDAARTRRLMSYMDSHPDVEFACMSGSISSKSIKDYYHLIKWALKDHNPLPNSVNEANDWAELLDSNAMSIDGREVWFEGEDGWRPDRQDAGSSARGKLALEPLVRWARNITGKAIEYNVEGFRQAYQVRLRTCPGVHSTGDASVGASLMVHNTPIENPEATEGWDKLKEHMDRLNNEMVTPSGDEIDHAIHTFKWMYELSAGFYNMLIWPEAGEYAERKNISEPEAFELLERAKVHHEAGQDYHKALRKWLKDCSWPGMDTPFLVGQELHRNGADNLPGVLYHLWREWKQLDFDGRPERDSIPVRVCPYKVNRAVQWAKKLHPGKPHGGGIIWVHNQEMGLWVSDALTQAGIASCYCPAGPQGNLDIRRIGDPSMGGKGDEIAVASISAHGEGKNLQAFQKQLFLQWPRPAKTAEQVLGRLHRMGQLADEIVVETCNTLEFDHTIFAACINDALYIHQTTGNAQKLVYCVYDPLPTIYSTALLRERGMDPQDLSEAQIRLRMERFGA